MMTYELSEMLQHMDPEAARKALQHTAAATTYQFSELASHTAIQ